MSIWTAKGTLAEAYWNTGRANIPVYDMHGHMGAHGQIYFKRSDTGAMIAHLKKAGITKLAFSHHHSLWTPDFSNREVFEITRRHPDILRMYVGVNPNHPDRVIEDVKSFDRWTPAAIGFKFLSAYHQKKITDKGYEPALKFADERKLPILLHTWGGDRFVPIDLMIETAQKYPNAIFFMGHSFRADWDGVARLHRACPDNVYFELTSIPGTSGMVEKLVELVGSERLLYGTDLPWFDEFQGIGGIVSARISENDMHNILYRNIDNLLGKDW
jgi:hypothetical protein